jgi:hypothetical protein
MIGLSSNQANFVNVKIGYIVVGYSHHYCYIGVMNFEIGFLDALIVAYNTALLYYNVTTKPFEC